MFETGLVEGRSERPPRVRARRLPQEDRRWSLFLATESRRLQLYRRQTKPGMRAYYARAETHHLLFKIGFSVLVIFGKQFLHVLLLLNF